MHNAHAASPSTELPAEALAAVKAHLGYRFAELGESVIARLNDAYPVWTSDTLSHELLTACIYSAEKDVVSGLPMAERPIDTTPADPVRDARRELDAAHDADRDHRAACMDCRMGEPCGRGAKLRTERDRLRDVMASLYREAQNSVASVTKTANGALRVTLRSGQNYTLAPEDELFQTFVVCGGAVMNRTVYASTINAARKMGEKYARWYAQCATAADVLEGIAHPNSPMMTKSELRAAFDAGFAAARQEGQSS